MNSKMSSSETPHSAPQKSYASRVFQESSVGMVSSLAQTSSRRRQFFKVFVLIFCLTGFLYQSGEFLTAVFHYPTSVDIDIIRPEIFNIPGYTFCNNNGLKRSLFCEKYPERCEEADEAFCDKYYPYCGENTRTLMPKKEYYTSKLNMSVEEITELSTNLSSFLRNPDSDFVFGPYLRMKHRDDPNMMLCYSVNDKVNSSLDPLQTRKTYLIREPTNQFTFSVEGDEIFVPGTRAGVLFSIHSPFDAANPFEKGIFMKPGRTYMIYVSMDEEILLQTPYETDCINYTERWQANGRTGPRMQEMCRHECFLEVSLACFNCAMPFLLFPTSTRLCTLEDTGQRYCSDIEDLLDQCDSKCKDDCQRTKYYYNVQERYSVNLNRNGDVLDQLDRIINVEIFLEDDEIIVLKHSPKYMFVEVFSTIGGFIGGWLGISLLDVTDILEGFFRITRYSLKRR